MVIMFFMPEKRQTGLPNFEWAGALRACIGTLVGIGLGVPFCIVLDPYPRDFDHVGATLACLAVGVMGGGGGGCYLSLVRGVKRRAAKAAVGVVLLLSFAAPIAVISGTALERMAGGMTGAALGVPWAIVLLGSVPVGAYAVASGTQVEKWRALPNRPNGDNRRHP